MPTIEELTVPGIAGALLVNERVRKVESTGRAAPTGV